MALKIDKTIEGYIRVLETSWSFTDTKINVILYDIDNNRKKVNNNDWYEMDQRSRDWVIKYYLPKIK